MGSEGPVVVQGDIRIDDHASRCVRIGPWCSPARLEDLHRRHLRAASQAQQGGSYEHKSSGADHVEVPSKALHGMFMPQVFAQAGP